MGHSFGVRRNGRRDRQERHREQDQRGRSGRGVHAARPARGAGAGGRPVGAGVAGALARDRRRSALPGRLLGGRVARPHAALAPDRPRRPRRPPRGRAPAADPRRTAGPAPGPGAARPRGRVPRPEAAPRAGLGGRGQPRRRCRRSGEPAAVGPPPAPGRAGDLGPAGRPAAAGHDPARSLRAARRPRGRGGREPVRGRSRVAPEDRCRLRLAGSRRHRVPTSAWTAGSTRRSTRGSRRC